MAKQVTNNTIAIAQQTNGSGAANRNVRIGLQGNAVLTYFGTLPVFAMDVSGNIGVILNQKEGNVFSIAPDAMVFEAIELMAEKNVGALLVMKGAKLVGVISERDYTRKVFLRGKKSKETRVDEIMSTSVMVTHPN